MTEEARQALEVLSYRCQEELLAHEPESAQAQAPQSDLVFQRWMISPRKAALVHCGRSEQATFFAGPDVVEGMVPTTQEPGR